VNSIMNRTSSTRARWAKLRDAIDGRVASATHTAQKELIEQSPDAEEELPCDAAIAVGVLTPLAMEVARLQLQVESGARRVAVVHAAAEAATGAAPSQEDLDALGLKPLRPVLRGRATLCAREGPVTADKHEASAALSLRVTRFGTLSVSGRKNHGAMLLRSRLEQLVSHRSPVILAARGGAAAGVGVVLSERGVDSTGLVQQWPCEEALASLLVRCAALPASHADRARRGGLLDALRVLELGAGSSGLAGCALARAARSCDVTLTDGHPEAARALARHVWLNSADGGPLGYLQNHRATLHSDCLVFDAAAAERRRADAGGDAAMYAYSPLHSRYVAQEWVADASARLPLSGGALPAEVQHPEPQVVSPSYVIGFVLATPLQAAELGLSMAAASPLQLPRSALPGRGSPGRGSPPRGGDAEGREQHQLLFGPVAVCSNGALPSPPALTLGPAAVAVSAPAAVAESAPRLLRDDLPQERRGAGPLEHAERAGRPAPVKPATSRQHAAQRRKRQARERKASVRSEQAHEAATRICCEVMRGSDLSPEAASECPAAAAVAAVVLGVVDAVVRQHRTQRPVSSGRRPPPAADVALSHVTLPRRHEAGWRGRSGSPDGAHGTRAAATGSHVRAYNLIVASDVLFFEAFHDDLLHALAMLLQLPRTSDDAAPPATWAWRMVPQSHDRDPSAVLPPSLAASPAQLPSGGSFSPSAGSVHDPSLHPQAWLLAPSRGGSLWRFVERARRFCLEACNRQGSPVFASTGTGSRCAWRVFDVDVYAVSDSSSGLLDGASGGAAPPAASSVDHHAGAGDTLEPFLVVLRMTSAPTGQPEPSQ
jgi:hypothetical protein